MAKEFYSTNAGKCAACGSEELEFIPNGFGHDGEELEIQFICRMCGAEGCETYRTEYINTYCYLKDE